MSETLDDILNEALASPTIDFIEKNGVLIKQSSHRAPETDLCRTSSIYLYKSDNKYQFYIISYKYKISKHEFKDKECTQFNNIDNEIYNKHNFTWDDKKEDPDIIENGVTIAYAQGTAKMADIFVRILSYVTGHKCDFSINAGRIRIDTYYENIINARKYINNTAFMKLFIKPMDDNSFDYFILDKRSDDGGKI